MLVTPMGLTVIVCLINKGILCQLSVHISVHTWVWTQSAGGCSLCLTARSMDLFSLSSLWLEHMVNPPTVGTPGIKKSTLMERKKKLHMWQEYFTAFSSCSFSWLSLNCKNRFFVKWKIMDANQPFTLEHQYSSSPHLSLYISWHTYKENLFYNQ